MGLSGQSGCHKVQKIIQNPELFHCSQNSLREWGALCRDAAVHGGSWDIMKWREHTNFPHFHSKRSQEEPTPKESSVVLRHLHQEEKSRKYSKRPAGVWGTHDLELVEITIQMNPHIFYIQCFRKRRKQLHSERLIKNPNQYTNRKILFVNRIISEWTQRNSFVLSDRFTTWPDWLSISLHFMICINIF